MKFIARSGRFSTGFPRQKNGLYLLLILRSSFALFLLLRSYGCLWHYSSGMLRPLLFLLEAMLFFFKPISFLVYVIAENLQTKFTTASDWYICIGQNWWCFPPSISRLSNLCASDLCQGVATSASRRISSRIARSWPKASQSNCRQSNCSKMFCVRFSKFVLKF